MRASIGCFTLSHHRIDAKSSLVDLQLGVNGFTDHAAADDFRDVFGGASSCTCVLYQSQRQKYA